MTAGRVVERAAVILAAGKGTRMSSDLPKVLHDVEGKPLVGYVIDAIRPLCGEGIYVVVGYRAESVKAALAEEGVQFVLQEEQLGTGHAVQQCESVLKDFSGTLAVLNGDVPCLQTETVRRFMDYHDSEGASASVMSAVFDDPTGYGRIVRDDEDRLEAIVEEKDADEKQRAIREINSGLFCFDKDALFDALSEMRSDNVQSEYYLTDVIGILRDRGEKVLAHRVRDVRDVTGVNTDEELERIRRHIRG